MKLFILLLMFALFLQTTVININLCLILVVAEALAASNRSNLTISFFTGILLGVMSSVNIGIYSILFIVSTKIIEIFKSSTLSGSFLSAVPLCVMIYFGAAFFEKIFLNQGINLSKVIWELLTTAPVYLIIKLIQERFIVKPGIKLQVKS